MAGKKLNVYDRINILLDKDTFVEVDKYVKHHCTNFGMENKRVPGDGVVCGYGKIDGRLVFVYGFDFNVLGGSLSAANATKIAKMQDAALRNGAPIISLNDSGGARIQEGIESLTGFAHIFYRNVQASGVIPQISAIMGPCAGGSCYSPALTDFILMVKDESQMFITGPNVVKQVTNEECDKETLGGADIHSTQSGVANFTCESDEECLMTIRELIGFLPSNNMEDAPIHPATDELTRECHELENVVPTDPNIPYDIKDIICPICDHQYFFEIQPNYAKNIVIGFGRMAGRTTGFVANQPNFLAGAIDIDASDKAARFIRFCDCFNIPLVAIEDVPGFLPGIKQEHNGIIRHGAKIVYAFAEATVPKVTLITRRLEQMSIWPTPLPRLPLWVLKELYPSCIGRRLRNNRKNVSRNMRRNSPIHTVQQNWVILTILSSRQIPGRLSSEPWRAVGTRTRATRPRSMAICRYSSYSL